MRKITYEKLLVSCGALLLLAGCATTSFDTGWSHDCTLLCTNVSTNQQEEIQRTGKNADFSAVCKQTQTTCEAGRSAACVNTANWTNAHEPLYTGCTSTSFGACTSGCARE